MFPGAADKPGIQKFKAMCLLHPPMPEVESDQEHSQRVAFKHKTATQKAQENAGWDGPRARDGEWGRTAHLVECSSQ